MEPEYSPNEWIKPRWPVVAMNKITCGDCLDLFPGVPDQSVDAVITDPPYAEINRSYGTFTEDAWRVLMDGVVDQVRRVLKPSGSAVFILQNNCEMIGRTRPWLYDFIAYYARHWNMVQDVYWWNYTAPPTAHCQRERGLMRPSVKLCVWLGDPHCYKNQSEILWRESNANAAKRRGARCERVSFPSGHSMNREKCSNTTLERSGAG